MLIWINNRYHVQTLLNWKSKKYDIKYSLYRFCSCKKHGFTYPEPWRVCSHVCSSDSCMCLHTHLWQRMIGPDLRAALCAVSVWGRFTVRVLHAACHQPEGSAGVWRAHHCINGAPSSRSNVFPPPPVKKTKTKTKRKRLLYCGLC